MTTPALATQRLSAEEAAARLGISTDALYRAVRAGLVPCCRIGRRCLFFSDVLERWRQGRDQAGAA